MKLSCFSSALLYVVLNHASMKGSVAAVDLPMNQPGTDALIEAKLQDKMVELEKLIR